MTPRLLHVIASTDPASGGPIEALRQLDHRWTQDGSAVSEVVSTDPADARYLTRHPFPVHAMGGTSTLSRLPGLQRYGYSERLVPWLRAHVADYDAVIVHGLWNYASLAASRVLVGASTPYFVFTHGMLDPWFRKRYPLKHVAKQLFWTFGEGRLLAGADAVLFTCAEEQKLARKPFLGHPYKGLVVGLGISAPPDEIDERQARALAEAVPELGPAPYILFFGRIHPKKGCDLLIEAFARTAAQSDVRLVMAGPDSEGWAETLKQRADALGVADRVVWPGPLYDDAKWGALRGAQAMILPSHQENFGIAVAEALAVGTPVLISDKVNIWREIEESGGGLVETDTLGGTEALLSRWLSLSDDARRTMRFKALVAFQRHFDIRETAASLVRVIEATS
ncbi:MAG: glycosyltransferase [Alphaproteobacteria bacterium]|nr:glycosyltransferase [Alphaproteobacteria bacterium]MBU2378740.1 glycosyltransferase [Alphaproteobacteria bacterium]